MIQKYSHLNNKIWGGLLVAVVLGFAWGWYLKERLTSAVSEMHG